jgi:beta-phosphoglucomutase-like phosphatase (HAD superfamily)
MNRPELPQIPTKWAVLVDLDGTVADHEARLKLIPTAAGGDWEPFYRNQINDPTFEGVAEIVRRLQDLFIVIVTARPEKYREESQQWLVNNRIPYDAVLMRAEGDHRPNEEVKQDMLDQVYALGWTPFIAFEDHPDTIKMFRDAGIETLAVSSHWVEYDGGEDE